MKTLGKYVKPYLFRMSAGLAIKLIGTLMDLVLPYLLAYTIDTVVPERDVGAIYAYGLLMVVCAFVALLFNVVANRMASRVSSRVVERLRHDLFGRVMRLPLAGADRFGAPSLISRLSNDTYNVHSLLDRTQRLGVRAPMLVLGGMVMTFLLEPALALVLLVLAPLLLLLVALVSQKGIPLYDRAQKSVEGLVRTVRENAAGVRVIKALSKAGYERERFRRANDDVSAAEKRAGAVMAATNPGMSFLLNAGLMLVIVIGARRVDAGLMQTGKIIAFLSYFTIILNAMLSVTKIFVLWSRGIASAGRIEEVFLSDDSLKIAAPDHVDTDAYLSFEHVTFSYNGRRNNLEDISFAVGKGRTLGILGPTGAGKTTLVALLMRLYDATGGTIRIAGDAVGSIPEERLRNLFGTVFQNDVLLGDTVYENISFLRDLPMTQVEAAAECAQAAAFIAELPDGYHTHLGIRGQTLSGGQRQRILIARALAAAPEILILDDAQSALDYRTDALLRGALRRVYATTTTIVISERISAIKGADRILVLDDGKQIGLGTHEELMASCPAYRRIADVQMGGAEE